MYEHSSVTVSNALECWLSRYTLGILELSEVSLPFCGSTLPDSGKPGGRKRESDVELMLTAAAKRDSGRERGTFQYKDVLYEKGSAGEAS